MLPHLRTLGLRTSLRGVEEATDFPSVFPTFLAQRLRSFVGHYKVGDGTLFTCWGIRGNLLYMKESGIFGEDLGKGGSPIMPLFPLYTTIADKVEEKTINARHRKPLVTTLAVTRCVSRRDTKPSGERIESPHIDCYKRFSTGGASFGPQFG